MTASAESAALAELYQGWTARFAANPGMDIHSTRDLYDSWGRVTAEPHGVSYRDARWGGIKGIEAIPAGHVERGAVLYVHGGGFTSGSSASHRKLAGHIANAVGVRVAIPDYPLFPENPFPESPIGGIREVYEALLDEGLTSSQIALAGDSAGGATVTLLALKLRDDNVPLPSAVVALSPWYDFTASSESLEYNSIHDSLASREASLQLSGWFLDGAPRDAPHVNALFADLRGLPPFFVSAGAHEVLLDDSTRFVEKARAAGVEVELEIGDEQLHVFQFLAGVAPEADRSVARIGDWLRARLHIEQGAGREAHLQHHGR